MNIITVFANNCHKWFAINMTGVKTKCDLRRILTRGSIFYGENRPKVSIL